MSDIDNTKIHLALFKCKMATDLYDQDRKKEAWDTLEQIVQIMEN